MLELNTIHVGNCLDILKDFPDESIDMCITSPPYWNLRDYGTEEQLGLEKTYEEYLNTLISIFDEVYRVLKKEGSCWVNIGDTYSNHNSIGVRKQSLIGIPDRFKIMMIDKGWLCRNEIIWHKPNAIPSSAKNRFTTDFEKMFFFTKDDRYYFETQYEEAKSTPPSTSRKRTPQTEFVIDEENMVKEDGEFNLACLFGLTEEGVDKYLNDSQEKSVRQGMSKTRGEGLIEIRPKLPTQKDFVAFMRNSTSIRQILGSVEGINKTTIEHWFRRDRFFSYPTIEHWRHVKHLVSHAENFQDMDERLTYVEYETDDINKNAHKGRLKRTVWSVNTKPFRGGHFAPYPSELVRTPIQACCPEGGVVLDIFMGSGTTGLVAKELNRNYIGIEINKEYVEIANKRIRGEI